MESEEQWARRDFTQIKPRRPEGPAEEEWEEVEAPFSFLWSGVGVEDEDDGGGGMRDRNGEEENEREEFEFSSGVPITTTAPTVVERSGISPADELFFQGQLLPLHLPPRIQMVKKLSLEKQQQQQEEMPSATTSQLRNAHQSEEIIARVNALMQARFSRLFQPKYSKFCVNTPSSEQVDLSPPIPARRGNSWWDPRGENSGSSTDRDSSDSSSRDSSGSSQDCFESSTDSKGTSFLHNREVFSTHSTYPGEHAGGISTRLRPPFKWKVLFGAKKSSSSRSSCDSSLEPKTQFVETAPPEFFPTSPNATDRYYSDCSGELTLSGNLHLSSRAVGHDHPRGARGYLQRYMKALNPSRSSKSDEGAPRKQSSPAVATSRSFPPFSQSFRISPKEISLKMNKSRPPLASPGPPRRVNTYSASSELHSAIQGAIAHCKESQKQSQRQEDVRQAQSSTCLGENLQEAPTAVT